MDKIEVQEVMQRYAAGIDELDFTAYRKCFAEELTVHGMRESPVNGVNAWVEFVKQALTPYRATQHMLGPPMVTIEGDIAHVRTDLQAKHFYREPKGRCMTLWGTYSTEMKKTSAGWKISRHELRTVARQTEMLA